MEKQTKATGKYLMYKGKPLVREGNTICWGDMSEKYILVLEIMSYKKVNDRELPDKIFVQILESANQNKIYKQAAKEGLYDAFSMGEIWLERALLSAE